MCTQVALVAAPPLLDVLIPFPVNVVLTSLFIIYIGSHMSMDPDLSTDEVWFGCWVWLAWQPANLVFIPCKLAGMHVTSWSLHTHRLCCI